MKRTGWVNNVRPPGPPADTDRSRIGYWFAHESGYWRSFLRCLRLEVLRMCRQDMALTLLALILAGYGASVGVGAYQWYIHHKHAEAPARTGTTVVAGPDSILSVQEPALRPLFTSYDVGFPVYSIHSITISDQGSSTKQEEWLATPAGFTLIGLSLVAVLVGVQMGGLDAGGQNLASVIAGPGGSALLRAVRACAALLFVCGAYVTSVWVGGAVLGAVQVQAWPLVAKQAAITSVFGALYLAIFLLLGALCGVKTPQSGKGMAIAIGLWLALVMILPQALPPVVRLVLGPVSSPVQVEVAIANVRTHNQDLANFTASHLPPQDTDSFIRLYRQSEGDTLHWLVTLEERQQALLARVSAATRMTGMLDPALALQWLMLRASGYDTDHLIAFRQSLLAYKLDVAEAVFVARERHIPLGPVGDWRAVSVAPHVDATAGIVLSLEFAVLLLWFLRARDPGVDGE